MKENAALLEHLRTRRTVPSLNLAGARPDEATITTFLEIASRVPDHGKLAPWRFIIYPEGSGKEIGDMLRRIWQAENADAPLDRLELEEIRFCRAPLVIGVVSKPVTDHKIPVWEQELSAGAVCLNLIHAAYAFGYVGQWLSEWYSYHEKASRYLGAREDERFAGFIHIGTPKIAPSERARPDTSMISTSWSAPTQMV